MNIGKISKKGQIVIPKEIRKKINIKPGDAIIFKVQDGKVILEKIQEKMKDILKESKPIEPSLVFQKKMRDEWE
ncbi:MAG TPA: AbrB/MazE/SpoVT family DNA-binding domain-containing protein [Candidatus Deferrimicrobium sp.]|nr:AbrB/MazE/SpoVT family DNA-binding domain-containing protein [Candidatus Deferrimicrobium sp.]